MPAFFVALLLDILLVGKIALRLASKFPYNCPNALVIPIIMVLLMVSFMSIFGIIIEFHSFNNFKNLYIKTWILNFIMALPLQMLIVGPISRKILSIVSN